MTELSRPPTVERATITAEALERSLHDCGVIPVVQLPQPRLAVPLSEILMQADLGCIEITFRSAGAAEAIAAVRRHVPDIIVGAGTVLTIDDAARAIDAGAHFVVAPGTNPKLVDFVTSRGITMVPGVATPSEIEANLERGLRILKFFPAAALGGVEWLKAVRGPFRTVKFIPSGGVTVANLAEYLSLPNVLACGLTSIAPLAVLEAGDLERVKHAAGDAVAVVRQGREAASVGAVRP
jgi:2-dehydro-3-deoxyphosphogluconate aldolase / (4S)-4-hydroxy-2-oxoglutarate aldolase